MVGSVNRRTVVHVNLGEKGDPVSKITRVKSARSTQVVDSTCLANVKPELQTSDTQNK
jgi:hypothetical protein